LLASIPAEVAPALATTTDAGGVTLLFDQDDTLPEPTAPWQLTHPEELPTGSSATADSR
jgi:hypothetical protein